MDSKAIDVALAALESVEIRSLSWGFVDQSLDEAEAEEAIASALEAANIAEAAEDVLDALVDAALVRTLRDTGGRRYRTRVAELTRLLVRLRQWFPGQTWQAAPTLVSDFRLDIRPRRFPRRHVVPTDAWQKIAQEMQVTPLQSRLWLALTANDPVRKLADFQIDATRRLLVADRGTGTIVTAGTGSGKTLAFYLPALLRIAPEVHPGDWWTKAVCLYPRQELLKDQLSEAYALALRTVDVLKQDRRRPIAIGSFFGPTPFQATTQAVADAGWRSQANGFICPYLRCPHCDGEMMWPTAALNAQREVLRCIRATCGMETPPDTLRLTRSTAQKQPPDLLFSTTEMMNQRLSDTWTRQIFGVGQDSSRMPLLALLDEAHTYSGVSGAQTALLLRRWTSLLGTKMLWAGLSATLPNAAQFFSDLTGVWIDNVATITPAAADMDHEGAEYHIILRSDPSSQAATLSTSIQTVMLLARMLDAPDQEQSEGRFGSKAFVFTDDLDVTHRLFDNLLDAEAYTAWRRLDTTRAPLAALRSSNGPDAVLREREGQRWQMAEDLRGQLSNRLVIGRTTSRDPGVDAAANVIVATSSLEVGFNDPDVGAVVQHKAPRSAASFLQRRGRAGRSRAMRPITVVVLSDYGRDRAAFQSYEQLFEPSVEIASLPVRNLYVLRMQAVYATLDWIAIQAPGNVKGWSWRALTGPDPEDRNRNFREHAKSLLQLLLKFDAPTIHRLRGHLQSSLTIDSATLDSVLWHPPRSLLLEALPTLARRLFRDWRLAYGDGLDLHQDNPPHPLPDFIPSNLFSDLNLPEVHIALPPPTQDREAMPIVSALQQFAPGRVRRRFADGPGNVSHWVPLDVALPAQDVTIYNYAIQHEFVGTFDGVRDGVASQLPVYRPWEIEVEAVPRAVSNTSNSRWNWQSSFEALGNPTFIDLPARASVAETIQRLEMRLHRFGAGLSVRRFAHDGQASLRVGGQDRQIDYRLVDGENHPAAVGFAIESDALIAAMNLPTPADIAALPLEPRVDRWLRYLALKQRSSTSIDLPSALNEFRRDWLHQVVLLGAIVLAERRASSIEIVLRELYELDDPGQLTPFVEALVSGEYIPDLDDDDGTGAPPAAVTPTTLGNRLRTCLAEPGVLRTFVAIALRWIAPADPDWAAWLSELASATISEAMYMACITAAPQSAAAEGLTVDVDLGEGRQRVIIAETTLGGGGTLEALSEVFAAEPRAFVRALESACTPSDQEIAADALRRLLNLTVDDLAVGIAMADLRAATDTADRDAARSALFALLADRGVPVSRTLSVLLATRFVRPGSNATSDQLTSELIKCWESLEERYGVALPVRVAAPAVVLTSKLGSRLAAIGGAGNEILTAHLLLWPAGGELRQKALQSYNPYRAEPYVDSALGRLLLFDLRVPVVQFGAENWLQRLNEALANHGVVRLVAHQSERMWRASIIGMLSTPIVSGFLHFYPMVEAIRTLESGHLAIDLLLRERV